MCHTPNVCVESTEHTPVALLSVRVKTASKVSDSTNHQVNRGAEDDLLGTNLFAREKLRANFRSRQAGHSTLSYRPESETKIDHIPIKVAALQFEHTAEMNSNACESTIITKTRNTKIFSYIFSRIDAIIVSVSDDDYTYKAN